MQLANRLNDIAESITLAVTAKANALKKAGVDVVSFGAGEPDFDTPGFIKDAAIKALQAGKTKYEPTHRLNDIADSITLAGTAKANALKKAGVDVVSFGAGEPDFDTPGFIKDAAIKALQAGKTRYEPTPGTAEARKAIAEKLKRENGLDYTPEQTIVSVGGKHSLY